MNIQDYTAAALTFDTHRRGTMLHSLTHGLVSEAIEVMEACLVGDTGDFLASELGDVMWELASLAHLLSIPLDALEAAEAEHASSSLPDPVSFAIELVGQAGRVSALMEKRGRVNYRVPKADLKFQVLLTWQRLAWLIRLSGWDLGYIREQNIDKLSARYGREEAA